MWPIGLLLINPLPQVEEKWGGRELLPGLLTTCYSLTLFFDRWWENKRKCDFIESQPTVEFGIKHMAGVFIVGAGGLVCAILFFLAKKWFVRVRNRETGADADKGLEETLYATEKGVSKEDIVNAVRV